MTAARRGRERQDANYFCHSCRQAPSRYRRGLEVRGVAAGESFATNIRILDAKDGGKRLVDLRSMDASNGPITHVRKVIGLESLDPGAYILEVTITSAGKSVERKVGFRVVKR